MLPVVHRYVYGTSQNNEIVVWDITVSSCDRRSKYHAVDSIGITPVVVAGSESQAQTRWTYPDHQSLGHEAPGRQ